MTGLLLMKCIIVIYIVTACVFAYERNWFKMWYWLAAAQITASVSWMK